MKNIVDFKFESKRRQVLENLLQIMIQLSGMSREKILTHLKSLKQRKKTADLPWGFEEEDDSLTDMLC